MSLFSKFAFLSTVSCALACFFNSICKYPPTYTHIHLHTPTHTLTHTHTIYILCFIMFYSCSMHFKCYQINSIDFLARSLLFNRIGVESRVAGSSQGLWFRAKSLSEYQLMSTSCRCRIRSAYHSSRHLKAVGSRSNFSLLRNKGLRSCKPETRFPQFTLNYLIETAI